jgi:hypothetical protein
MRMRLRLPHFAKITENYGFGERSAKYAKPTSKKHQRLVSSSYVKEPLQFARKFFYRKLVPVSATWCNWPATRMQDSGYRILPHFDWMNQVIEKSVSGLNNGVKK